MARDILDRSREQMVLFNREIEVDRTLPKWSTISEDAKAEVDKDLGAHSESVADAAYMAQNANDHETYARNMVMMGTMADEIKKRTETSIKKTSVEDISNMSLKEFNIYLEKKRLMKVIDSWGATSSYGTDLSNDILFADDKDTTIFRRLKNLFGEFLREQEEQKKIDIIEFFSNVKLESKKTQQKYAKRVAPIAIAIRDAEAMGQKALVDALLSELYREKYESVLYASGVLYKITEKEMAKFINKTEKGVALDYVANFARPIPKSVLEAKKKADELHVFDNYVVLYYDPDGQKRLPTQAEREKERAKKTDPILFGVIQGVRSLYYITDWIDEYCDLTLEEFLTVSDVKRKEIEIKKNAVVTVGSQTVELK